MNKSLPHPNTYIGNAQPTAKKRNRGRPRKIMQEEISQPLTASGAMVLEPAQEPVPMQIPPSSDILSASFLQSIRLPQNFGDSLSVKKLATRIPVRKPNKTDFFRVRVGEEWRLQTMILEMKEEGETYVLAPALWGLVSELLRPAVLHVGIDRRNNIFLIPIPLAGEDGRRNSWHQSLSEAVDLSEKKWIRIVSNKSVSGYDVYVAEADLGEPVWPDLSLDELVQIAFRNNFINSLDHPVIRQLLGSA